MTTGRTVVSRCPARAALAGNPSDGYGGAVVAVPVPDIAAMAAMSESPTDVFTYRSDDADLDALVRATVDAYRDEHGEVPAGELSVSTNVPRSVGLGGSSAIVIAVLQVLAAYEGRRWEPIPLAQLALSVERDRLGIEAGLQDRLVQAVGRPVSMEFAPVSFEALELADEFQLFVAWEPEAEAPSDVVHRSLRRRFDGGDERVRGAMGDLAVQAARARRGILAGDAALLADAMHRTLAIRLAITDVAPGQRRLIEIGRTAGAALNSAGSGGSVVGLARHPDHLATILDAYAAADVPTITLAGDTW